MKFFEDKFRIPEEEIPILVLDLRVSLFSLLFKANYYPELFSDLDVLKLFWQEKIHCPIKEFPGQRYQVIIVDDFKYSAGNYWRDTYLQSISKDFPKYKGNRDYKARPELYYDLLKAGHEYIEENNLPLLRKRGFEADDFAGALATSIAKIKPDRHTFLYTVDSDWGQLINDDLKILFYYCNSPAWKHKLRNEQIILEWFKERQNITLSEVREIVDYKLVEGDKSDNLIPGSPREVIDLLNPGRLLPKKWITEIDRLISNPQINSNPRKSFEARMKINKLLMDNV